MTINAHIMTILVADSGSTKTDWRVLTQGQNAYQLITNGINPYYADTNAIVATLTEQLLSHLPADKIEAVHFYGAGCANPEANAIVERALRQLFPNLTIAEVNSDMLGAARGACQREPGIVCILGTGANACCYDGNQITRGIQSLGFWLGDEGSGGYLGKTLVRDYFQSRLPDALNAAFAAQYPQLDRATLLDHAYKKPFPNRYFASFTPFLSEHINHPYANQLVIDAFVLFLQTYVVPFPESSQWPVNFVGSVAHHFEAQLRQTVETVGCTMGRIIQSPGDGLVGFHA